MNYETLVISGGSTKGVGILGALCYINQIFDLSKITNFYGTSVGSIIIVLLALDFLPEEIFLYFTQFKFTPCLDLSKNNIQILNYSGFKKFIEVFILSKYESIPSLFEIRKLGKNIHMITYNYSENKIEILSADTYPEMSCVSALSLSCALPVIFGLKTPETEYKGNYYFDGGLVCNFPLDLAVENFSEKILALNISPSIFHSSSDLVHSILLNLMFVSIEDRTKRTIEKYKNHCTLIELQFPIPFTKFDLGFREAFENFVRGWIQATKFL